MYHSGLCRMVEWPFTIRTFQFHSAHSAQLSASVFVINAPIDSLSIFADVKHPDWNVCITSIS
jgi:hypothetical protein